MIESLGNWNPDDSIIVISGTTAETYLVGNYPDIQLQKFDSYATAKEYFENNPYEIDYVRVYQKDSYNEDVKRPVK